jgi:hypothetical protein
MTESTGCWRARVGLQAVPYPHGLVNVVIVRRKGKVHDRLEVCVLKRSVHIEPTSTLRAWSLAWSNGRFGEVFDVAPRLAEKREGVPARGRRWLRDQSHLTRSAVLRIGIHW